MDRQDKRFELWADFFKDNAWHELRRVCHSWNVDYGHWQRILTPWSSLIVFQRNKQGYDNPFLTSLTDKLAVIRVYAKHNYGRRAD